MLGLNTSDSYEIQEKLFQELIKNNNSIQSYILDALDLDSVNADFDKETKYINGITSDFTIISNSEITAIIECKRADINVTEYVRGIGQLFQYDYFYRKNIAPKNLSTLTYNSNRFVSVLIIPSTFIKNTQLNIGRFAYPKTFKLLEINLNNNYVRQITEDELNTLANAANENLVTISQYYIRDNRLFELYICLKYLRIKGSFNNREKLNRKDLEENLRKVETINNRNWRNVFISLSLLGFINSNNQLTEIGLIMSNKDYSDFILNMYQDYLKPFIDEIMDTLTSDKSSSIKISNDEISRKLRDKHGGKDILFLTESQNRYISSWMNILRDDFGCVQFRPRNSKREILYHPKKLNVDIGEIDVFFGGIVCKGFSLAGERSPNDERNYFYHKQLDLVAEFKPKISIIENVPGILKAKVLSADSPFEIKEKVNNLWKELENYKGKKAELRKKNSITNETIEEGKLLRIEKELLLKELNDNKYLVSVIDDIKNIYAKLGYAVYIKTLNSAWYGAATKRERVIIVAIRSDITEKFIFPEPKFMDESIFKKGMDSSLIQALPNPKTVNEALSSIDYSVEDSDNIPMNHSPKTVERFKYIPEGDSIANHIDELPEELKISKFYSRGSTMRLAGDKPSPTLVPGHSNFPVHPKENRSITVREAATITGFPLNYKFFGNHSKRCEHVGNAVPPALSRELAKKCNIILDHYYTKQ